MNRTYVCLDCAAESKVYAKIEDLEAHIAGHHLNMFPFACERCMFAKFPTEYALVTHSNRDHGICDFKITYRYTQGLTLKREELASKLRLCIESPEQGPKDVDPDSTSPDTSAANIKLEMLEDFPVDLLDIKPDLLFLRPNSRLRKPTKRPYDEYDEGSSKSNQQVQCQLCFEKISKQSKCKMYHANTRHGKFDLYECGYCQRKFHSYARSDVLRHIEKNHTLPNEEVNADMVIDNRKKFADMLKAIQEECFPDDKRRRVGYTDLE